MVDPARVTLAGEAAVPAAIADYEVVRLLGTGNHGRYYLARPPPGWVSPMSTSR